MTWSWQYSDLHHNRVGMRGGRREWEQHGKCCVLYAEGPVWVVMQPHEPLPQWPGSWVLMLFKVGHIADQGVADGLALEALRKTRRDLGDPPSGGLIAFVGQGRDDRFTWSEIAVQALLRAGFCRVGIAEDGAHILQLPADRFPSAWEGRVVAKRAKAVGTWRR